MPRFKLTFFVAASLLFLTGILIVRANDPAVSNGGFEFNNFSNWTATSGTHKHNVIIKGFAAGPYDPAQFSIAGPAPATDGVTGGSVVESGVYAARLGDGVTVGGKAGRLTYEFTPSASETKVYMNYAPVLQTSPGHIESKRAFFNVRVEGKGFLGGWKKIFEKKHTSGVGNEWKTTSNGQTNFRNWECRAVDISQYQGKKVRVEFTAADCSEGGHYGYAYIDSLSTTPPPSNIKVDFTLPATVCGGADVIADGSATINEENVFWSIEKSDANMGRPDPSSEVSQWFTNSSAGVINLSQFYASKGGKFECNKYYRIKLAGQNTCTNWEEKTKLLYISCPVVPPSQAICMKTANSLGAFGAAVNQSGYANAPFTYTWSNSSTLAAATTSQPLNSVAPDANYFRQNHSYVVEGTDSNGCKANATFDVFTRAPRLSVVSKDSCCKLDWEAASEAFNLVKWPVNQSRRIDAAGTPINLHFNSVGSQTITVSNACGSDSQVIQAGKLLQKPNLIYPNAFTPNGDGLNDVFIVYEHGKSVGATPAYGDARGYILRVFDRWGTGHIVNDKGTEAGTCSTLSNGDVSWDGKIKGVVQDGQYTFKIEFLGCGTTVNHNWHKVPIGSGSPESSTRDNDVVYAIDSGTGGCPFGFTSVGVTYQNKPVCKGVVTFKITQKNCDDDGHPSAGGYCLVEDNGSWWRGREIK